MSDSISTINASSLKSIDDNLKIILGEKIREWKQDYGKEVVPVSVVIQDADDKKLFKIVYSTSLSEQLDRIEDGIGKNILMSKIDVCLRPWKKKYEGKVCFTIFMGLTEEQTKRIVGMTEKKENMKRVLDICPIEPKFSMEQVVLPDKTKEEIKDIIGLLQNMSKIYEDWGFKEIDPVPRSIVNFWGPPGTGKTMTVQAIAKEMGKKLLILNYADIESKYVGEAPKNLMAAFDIARRENCIIFFDEADSFLGKRITNVDSGSEQAINSLRSQMLMILEEFEGTVFFATNLHENYDRAFESRILKHIEFLLPDVKCRKLIIKKKLPVNAPYSGDVKNSDGTINDELLTKLAETIEGFAGREIKNCVLSALVKASQSEEQCVTASLLEDTFMKAKEEADALKKKAKERKEKLSSTVKTNLDSNNFAVKKVENDKEVLKDE